MEDLIEYQGRNTSYWVNLNLLCKERNIYIMDNHNAALWCWLQEIDTNELYNVLHVDAHYDTKTSHIEKWIENRPFNFAELSISDYINLHYEDPNFGNTIKVMQWDNYFPIFHRLFGNCVNKYHFFTHKAGTMFNEMEDKLEEYPAIALCNFMDYLFIGNETDINKWIVNIDLDYFFLKIDDANLTLRITSHQAIDYFISKLNYYSERISVITIAMSPECCGGWENSIELLLYMAEKLNIDDENRLTLI